MATRKSNRRNRKATRKNRKNRSRREGGNVSNIGRSNLEWCMGEGKTHNSCKHWYKKK